MKKLGAILLVVALAVTLGLVPTASVGANPDPGIVGLWHFDEGTGTTASDSSGNVNDGTINGATWTTDSAFGAYALSFDGLDNYVEVDDSATLDGMSALTVEAWVYIGNVTESYHGIVDKTAGSGDRSYNLGLRNGKLEWGLANASNSKVYVRDDDLAPIGTWIHVAGTYDGTALRMYMNGNEVDVTPQTENVQESDTYLAFGRWPGGSYFFDGKIDEVHIWDEALTAEQIGEYPLAVADDIGDISGVSADSDWCTEWSDVELTAPPTVTEDYAFYYFLNWDVDGTSQDDGVNPIMVTMDAPHTATAHYTKVISVDKELTDCWHSDFDEAYWQLVDTVTVPSDGTIVESVTLEEGKHYMLKASGTFFAGGTHDEDIEADAEYS